ncbi:phage tail protein [Thalassococcus lentus]|uniref:Tail fiber protein n=1 Tax=Thalassococcus lentus TaxID=1210524 RepID=A0ABT4XVG9_9RHOB|nr:tail fiber protein [Thalassococcus lentus]MDA7425892.1 tail fiber protein [Thalassococcus lentus]
MKKICTKTATVALLALGFNAATVDKAAAQDAILGEVRTFGFNFCPRGWAEASGALLAINSNTALFSLLGTTFGGDGRTTFGLPDMRGRSALGLGTGPGLGNVVWGQRGGVESVVLNTAQLPAHNHSLNATNTAADQKRPNGDILAWPDVSIDGTPLNIYGNGTAEVQMESNSIGITGNNAPVSIRDPYIGMIHCIATEGVYPSRS